MILFEKKKLQYSKLASMVTFFTNRKCYTKIQISNGLIVTELNFFIVYKIEFYFTL